MNKTILPEMGPRGKFRLMGRRINKSMVWLLCMTCLFSCTRSTIFGQERDTKLVKVSADARAGEDVKKEIFRRMRSSEIKDRAWGVYLIGKHGLGEFGTGA